MKTMLELLIRLHEMRCCCERAKRNPQLTNGEKSVACGNRRRISRRLSVAGCASLARSNSAFHGGGSGVRALFSYSESSLVFTDLLLSRVCPHATADLLCGA